MTMTMTTRPGADSNKRDVAKQSKTNITNLCSKKREERKRTNEGEFKPVEGKTIKRENKASVVLPGGVFAAASDVPLPCLFPCAFVGPRESQGHSQFQCSFRRTRIP